ncbi:4-hydroxybenzoate octaprenyltransferase [Agrobacterium rosae]|uniref:4-hydroxybenzoate octaprenyltransferase n=1 Tax=Agrobacterium rosae TaxID=1972867 RepID=A0AAW9FHF8_9HYPH|nr:4-hydroxybenzoate octaprenyltransferase [Agrobacterium rosae]MDX8303014.1 4-hydroxybenzoate octaprenyltransferase [Agrobacterium rosae]POO56497.1 4-hydroxybenzoate octaprenyltransferase [Agrobacterium rosae]
MVDQGDLSGRVSDAPSNNWVYRILPRTLWPYAQLARWDRPIGWELLMWPCFWSAAMAANAAQHLGTFSWGLLLFHLFLFFAGSVAMRGAGCTYNDLVDHKIDMAVARTRSRPLPSGRVSRKQAKIFIVIQALVGLAVLLCFNGFAIVVGLSSLIFVAIYPFAKRFTNWPQFFLGLAFSWGALMGWAGQFGSLSVSPVLLYIGAIAWTIGYDTIYAHQDREDDTAVGIGSTALLFGDKTHGWLVGLYGTALAFIFLAFLTAGVNWTGYLGLAIAAFLLFRQVKVLDINNVEQCLALFKSNNRVGILIFAGLLLPLLVR